MTEPPPLPAAPPPPGVPGAGAPAAAPARVPAPQEASVSGLSCPSCGGALEVATGLRVVTCPYCQKPLLATGEIVTRRLAVLPKIPASRAREVAQGWLVRGLNKDRKLRTEAEIGEAFLCFLPFYRIEADAVGYALGTEQRTRTVGSGKSRRTQTYEVDVEVPVQASLDRTVPAVNVAEWGVRRVNLAGDQLVPFDPNALERLGMVFPATGSEPESRAAAIQEFLAESDPGARLHRVRFKLLHAVRERLSVLYYPLWVVRYRFRERSYQVVVDAEDGSVAYGKAPGNDLYRAVVMVLAEAAACFLATTAVHLAIRMEDDGGCGVVIAAGAGALAILGWGWRKFRHGGEVIEGTGAAEEESISGAFKKLSSKFPGIPRLR